MAFWFRSDTRTESSEVSVTQSVGVGPVHVVGEAAHPPVTPKGVVTHPEGVQRAVGVPGPDGFSLGRELHHGVGHDDLVHARRVRIAVAAVVILYEVPVGGERQEIAVGHLVGLVMQRLLAENGNGIGILGRCIGPFLGVELPYDVAQQVDLHGGEIRAVHEYVAVGEAGDTCRSKVRVVVPDDVAARIERQQHAPVLGKIPLPFGQPVRAPQGPAAHAQEGHARFHSLGDRDLDVQIGKFQRVGGQIRRGVGPGLGVLLAVRAGDGEHDRVFAPGPHACNR